MNLGFMVAGIFMANLIAPAYALSLKLSPEVDLLVVDGRLVSGPILKGADSLELDAGQHQILFQISKPLPQVTAVYHSPPIIVAFDARNSHAVSIRLPSLTTEQESRDFSQKMNITLIDEKGNQIDYRQDRLTGLRTHDATSLEAAMNQYNLSGQSASIPAFALSKKSAMTLNASNQRPESARIEGNASEVYLSFSLWSMLQHDTRSSTTAKWFSAQ
ncbi:DUF2057 family protein [Rouxiella badensis]|uniref:YccT family protein n=1 Tax=Rouxiella badensis TaxID=1646377 RepID=UPI0028D54029|nr:DUF2057 family protein [Rouxiella badensis]